MCTTSWFFASTSALADAPALGRGLLQHRARGGAALPHRLDEMPDAARAVGVLVAVFRLVAGRLLDADLGPVGFEFVGDDHRQRGARGAGAHLGAGRHDRDGAVLGDRR